MSFEEREEEEEEIQLDCHLPVWDEVNNIRRKWHKGMRQAGGQTGEALLCFVAAHYYLDHNQ